MPRRYATFAPQFATLHQVASLGALLIFAGQLIFVWNIVQSWLEGPRVEDGDPWELEENNLRTAEWQWFDRRLQTKIADGGDEEAVADGGQPSDD